MHIEGDWTRILEREVHKQPAAGHNGDRQRTYGQSGMSAANSPHEKCVFEKFMESVLLLIHSPHYEESSTCFEFKEIHEYFPCAVGLLLVIERSRRRRYKGFERDLSVSAIFPFAGKEPTIKGADSSRMRIGKR